MNPNIGRVIGIQPRVKKTIKGEARPTIAFVRNSDGTTGTLEFKTIQDELDFIGGCYVSSMRKVVPGEDLTVFKKWHVKRDKETNEPEKVPATYDGLKAGDTVVMIFGGAGSSFAFYLSRMAEKIGASFIRISPFKFKPYREKVNGPDLLKMQRETELSTVEDSEPANPVVQKPKKGDAELLVELAMQDPELFERIRPRDIAITRLQVASKNWLVSQRDRIVTNNRFLQAFEENAFILMGTEKPVSLDEVKKPVKKASKKAIASGSKEADESFAWIMEELSIGNIGLDEAKELARDVNRSVIAMEVEESEELKKVVSALSECDIYEKLFKPIEGVGPSISARIIPGIGTITRFATAPKLRKYCGVHVLDNGTFARRRNGEVANWSGEIRQGLYLLAEQFNRRPHTPWGERLIVNKAMYREKHPEKVLKGNGKLAYTNAHIHKMAIWRTLTEFVDWLFESWWNIERSEPVLEAREWFALRARRHEAYLAHLETLKAEPKGEAHDAEPIEKAA